MGFFTSVRFKLLAFGVLLASVITVGVLLNKRDSATSHRLLHINSRTLEVEIADDPNEITLGLSYRTQIGADGLLFVLSNRTIPAFWMKGMQFPLDFVWIDGDRVVDLTSNVPIQENATDSELILYRPKVAVTQVLELNAGAIESFGIKVGDSVRLQ